jgi:hypothetical protein
MGDVFSRVRIQRNGLGFGVWRNGSEDVLVRNKWFDKLSRECELGHGNSILVEEEVGMWIAAIDMVSRTAYILLCYLPRETKFMGR